MKKDHKNYFGFLDALRASGRVNMYGAAPVLQDAYPKLTHQQSAEIVQAWMDSFDEMNSEKCQHPTDSMCSCKDADSEHLIIDEPLKSLEHFLTHLTDSEWELQYDTLDAPGLYRLCIVGTCDRCGGRLCLCIDEAVGITGDDLLTSLYQHLSHLTYSNFREQVVQLFHAPDQTFVREWLDRPENRKTFKDKSETEV